MEYSDPWAVLDTEILDTLACGRPMSPAEIGQKLGMSADAAASLLTMLASSGRVRIVSVELSPEDGRRLRWAAR